VTKLFQTKVTADPYAVPDGDSSNKFQTPPQVARQLSFASGSLEGPPEPETKDMDIPPVRDLVAQVSVAATKKRVARLMTPKQDGTFKVPEELVKAWNSGEQDRLIREFVDCGMVKERLAKTPNKSQVVLKLQKMMV
jgi:hypothetical protein